MGYGMSLAGWIRLGWRLCERMGDVVGSMGIAGKRDDVDITS